MIKHVLTAFLFFLATKGLAQSNVDTIQHTDMSPLKAMSYEQYKAYTDGVDINGMALVAEVNHYPEPQKVMDLKRELGLTTVQASAIDKINIELHRKMKEMGGMIIKNEKALDDLFRTKKVNDGTLIFYANRYGLYQGELRNSILQACVKVQDILNPEQCKKYNQLLKGTAMH
jgi:hypothetical protein